MDFESFYKTLFIIAAVVLVYETVLDWYMRHKVEYYEGKMYNYLAQILDLYMPNSNMEETDKIKKVLRNECEKMYNQIVKENKYLQFVFSSPEDILIKFMIRTSQKWNKNEKLEILYDESEYSIEL